ncbi:hypothetical protein FZW96_01055 [Bacillus sp. BGMRC 2118]|nr:hypothetical protein FZW96_01055 [Bacillus sp. BGMRC 2118]
MSIKRRRKVFRTRGYTLRFTISLLVFLSVLLTAFVGCYSAIRANKESLSISYLQNNYQYAKKLKVETSNILSSMQRNITEIAEMTTDHVVKDEEMDFYLRFNNRYFNSIFFVNNEGVIQNISPSTTGVSIGTKLNSAASKQAIKERKPIISTPYKATSGRLILMISSPVFDDNRNYKGFIGGTIYLEDTNYLNSMLSAHFYGNGSYVYVVDREGRIIFHPDTGKINKSVIENKAVKDVLQGNSGSAIITNTQGKEYFVGYSYEPSSHWGIVSQTPTEVLKDPLKDLYRKMFLYALPLFIIIIFVSWWVAFWISKPLYLLAKYSEEVIRNNNSVPIINLETSSKIIEVQQLYHQINNHLILLNKEIQ